MSLLFSTVAAPQYIPANSVTRFPFPTSLPTFVICVLLDDNHSDRCEVVSHWGFDLHFLDDCRRWASFHVPVGHLNFLFGKCLFSSAHFSPEIFFFMLSYTSCLYMLDINPLSVISFANIFSHSVGCLIILSILSLLFSLILIKLKFNFKFN